MKEKLEVVSPVGGEVVKQNTVAPRLADLDGKTICETWTGLFKGDATFPVLRELLKQKYPGAKVIPYSEFPVCWADTPASQKALAKKIAALAKEKGCDALISGNGA
ncbi:MAG: hypothetical protein HY525_18600 [Betaproteobacteria bacterium]|nr:hypothetical protein [Betaproteobacteria bacterium]